VNTTDKGRRVAYKALGRKERLCYEVLRRASSLALGSLLIRYRQARTAGKEALRREGLFLEYAAETVDSGFSRYECLLLDFLPDAALYVNYAMPSEDPRLVQVIVVVGMFLSCVRNPPPEARDPQLGHRFMAGYEDWFAAHRDNAMPVDPEHASRERIDA
jgi:hypothetical protein